MISMRTLYRPALCTQTLRAGHPVLGPGRPVAEWWTCTAELRRSPVVVASPPCSVFRWRGGTTMWLRHFRIGFMTRPDPSIYVMWITSKARRPRADPDRPCAIRRRKDGVLGWRHRGGPAFPPPLPEPARAVSVEVGEGSVRWARTTVIVLPRLAPVVGRVHPLTVTPRRVGARSNRGRRTGISAYGANGGGRRRLRTVRATRSRPYSNRRTACPLRSKNEA